MVKSKQQEAEDLYWKRLQDLHGDSIKVHSSLKKSNVKSKKKKPIKKKVAKKTLKKKDNNQSVKKKGGKDSKRRPVIKFEKIGDEKTGKKLLAPPKRGGKEKGSLFSRIFSRRREEDTVLNDPQIKKDFIKNEKISLARIKALQEREIRRVERVEKNRLKQIKRQNNEAQKDRIKEDKIREDNEDKRRIQAKKEEIRVARDERKKLLAIEKEEKKRILTKKKEELKLKAFQVKLVEKQKMAEARKLAIEEKKLLKVQKILDRKKREDEKNILVQAKKVEELRSQAERLLINKSKKDALIKAQQDIKRRSKLQEEVANFLHQDSSLIKEAIRKESKPNTQFDLRSMFKFDKNLPEDRIRIKGKSMSNSKLVLPKPPEVSKKNKVDISLITGPENKEESNDNELGGVFHKETMVSLEIPIVEINDHIELGNRLLKLIYKCQIALNKQHYTAAEVYYGEMKPLFLEMEPNQQENFYHELVEIQNKFVMIRLGEIVGQLGDQKIIKSKLNTNLRKKNTISKKKSDVKAKRNKKKKVMGKKKGIKKNSKPKKVSRKKISVSKKKHKRKKQKK